MRRKREIAARTKASGRVALPHLELPTVSIEPLPSNAELQRGLQDVKVMPAARREAAAGPVAADSMRELRRIVSP